MNYAINDPNVLRFNRSSPGEHEFHLHRFFFKCPLLSTLLFFRSVCFGVSRLACFLKPVGSRTKERDC